MFDAIYVPHGSDLSEIADSGEVQEFLNDAYKHCKVIGADGEASKIVSNAPFIAEITNFDSGIVMTSEIATAGFAKEFINAMKMHRFWQREPNLYN